MSVEILKSKAISRMGSGMKAIVVTKVLEIIEKAYNEGIYVLITDGYRSVAEQNKLYTKGRTTAQLIAKGITGITGEPSAAIVTNAYGNQSYHTKGIAVDYCLTNKEGTAAYWTVNADWKRVAAIAKSMGFEWGGDWTSFKDNPHLEYAGKIKVTPETGVDSEKVTSPSSGNANVKAYQKFLNGYATQGKFTKLVEDGYTGPRTKAAYIRVYQHLVGVAVDGIFGPKSKAATPIVQKGKSSATWNKFVQGVLYCLGYDPKGFDGIFGNGMLAAIKQFQKDKKLVVDGIVGPNTFAKFFA
ncbi:MAG: peptidoglycan-binding protein [Niallia sp.]|nr:Peptidoglycan L-alanyl-D-glutamate endopeptidase CwlK precursor [Mycobacteroides abscessus subsp. abscessus]